ncbi:MAG: hypothetical protein WBO45_15085, partial [Planctomycetota bacterium]
MLARCLPFLLLLFAACGTVHDWRELKTAPMTFGECYTGIVEIASRELRSDDSVSDRGLGIWQSRWRTKMLERNFLGRQRLRVEVLLDEGSATDGWPIRYVVEQQKVEDLRRFTDPREDDWSDAGQDREAETLLGERLLRRLAPKAAGTPEQRRP